MSQAAAPAKRRRVFVVGVGMTKFEKVTTFLKSQYVENQAYATTIAKRVTQPLLLYLWQQ